MSSALIAIGLVCFVILCVTGTAAGGLWWAGRDKKTLELQLEANERWREEMQEKLEEEALALFQKALSFERDPNLLTSIAYAKLGRYRNARNPNPQDLIEAEAGIREAINEWGSISRMQAVLGDVLYTKGDYAGAYESYDTALVGMLNEGYLAEFTQEKLLSQTGRGAGCSRGATGRPGARTGRRPARS